MRQIKITNSITSRESIAVEKYLRDISKFDLLEDEETEVARASRLGDMQARERLINSNLRFVVSVAKQYTKQGMPLMDLISEGNIWLIEAANRFDETKGFKFISYAVWRIRQAILKALSEQHRIVRLPLNKDADARRVRQIISVLEQEYERRPDLYEIDEALDTNSERDQKIRQNLERILTIAFSQEISGDAPVSDEGDATIFDLFSFDETTEEVTQKLERASINNDMGQVLDIVCRQDEASILKLYYGINEDRAYGLEEIWEIFGLTREGIRQKKKRWIQRIKRNRIATEILKGYLWK